MENKKDYFVNDKELIEARFFDVEKIRNIYKKYFEEKVGFFKKTYARISDKDGNNYFNYETGEYLKELPSLERDYDMIYSYSYYYDAFVYVCRDEETDYIFVISYIIENPRIIEVKESVKVKNVLILNRYKFAMHLSNGEISLLENSKMKAFFNKKHIKDIEFNKIIDYYGRYVLGQGTRPLIITGKKTTCEYLNHKEVLPKNSKAQKLLNSIQDDNLEFVNYKEEVVAKDYPRTFRINPITSLGSKGIFVFAKGDVQLTKDGWLVIRGFYEFNRIGEKPTIVEAIRFYYKDNKFIKSRKCINNEFIIAQGILPEHCVFNIDFENITKEAFEKTNLKYYKEIIENTPSNNRMLFLYQLLSNPDIEKLYKLGFDFVVKEISSYTYNMHEVVWDYMGYPIGNTKNIANKYGLNSYQVKKIVNYIKDTEEIRAYDERMKIVKYLRYVQDDLSSLDNKTFDRIFDIITYTNDGTTFCGYYGAISFGKIVDKKGLQTAILRVETIVKLFKEEEHDYSLRTILLRFSDIIRMSETLSDYFNSDIIKIKSIKDIEKIHDNMVYILNKYKKEIYKTSFIENQKKWKKYFYEDETYLITAPTESDDLAKEGLELHHCVKSYIDAVVEGRTNILFLRKKEAPEKPFFTIELGNDNKIRQIHGFANCNITSDKDAMSFYLKWLQEKNIQNYTTNGVLAVGM